MGLYERALLLDPSSAYAMAKIAYFLINDAWSSAENLKRAGRLLAQARALEPQSAQVLNSAVYWLRRVGRCAGRSRLQNMRSASI